MENSLYVGNLSDDASTEALRTRFAEVAEVLDVQIAIDRASGRPRGHAFVTMATAAGVEAALKRLNGVDFDDRPLRVSRTGGDRSRSQPKAVEAARITSQFRQPQNMAYELDCEGVALLIKIFHHDSPTETRRLEVSVKQLAGKEAVAISASGQTRALALEDAARAWQLDSNTAAVVLDWPAITKAMAVVRAI